MTAARRLAALALLASACADPAGIVPPPPSPSPTPPAPGLLRGSYVLRVEAAPECRVGAGGASFVVQASPDATGRYPGVQAVDALPVPAVELELLDGGAVVRGGIGTDGGVPSTSGTFVWLELVATGDVTVGSDGVAEVLGGPAAGFVELGSNPNDQGGMGSCKSVAHAWSLRRQ